MALYHSAKGSVDYTIVGSPTIVDGVASGFGENDYLSLGNTFKLSATTVAEFVFKINANTLSTLNGICGTPGNYGFHFVIAASGKLSIYLGNNSSWSIISNAQGTTVLQANTDYYVKLSINNQVVSMYLSTDGITYTQEMSQTVTIPAEYTYSLAIGRVRATSQYFRGSIDLNKSYITYNGQPWFGICPIEVQKHQLMGPVGYTVVGSPTITDGVASGFSRDDCLRITGFDSSSNFEINLEIANNQATSSESFLELYPPNSNPIIFYTSTSGNISAYNGHNAYWNVVGSTDKTKSVIINLTNDGTNLNAKVYQEGVVIASSQKAISSLTGVNLGQNTYIKLGSATYVLAAFNGSIDLNETYIKVNGKLWFWQPRETEKIVVNGVEVWTKPQPPASDYTVHGSPTINGTVVSGFSSSNYLTIDKTLPSTITDYEIIFDVNIDPQNFIPQSGSSTIFGPSTTWGHAFCSRIESNGKLVTYAPSSFSAAVPMVTIGYCYLDSYSSTYSSILCKINRQTISGSQRSCFSFSLDGGNTWNLDWDYAQPDNHLRWDESFCIGNDNTRNNPLLGSVDLSKWSIKINGTKWWPDNL